MSDFWIVMTFVLLVLSPCVVAIYISRREDVPAGDGEASVTDARPATRLKSTIRQAARPRVRQDSQVLPPGKLGE